MKRFLALATLSLGAAVASAKLPPPNDEAKAKAAEAAAKTAHGNKVADFQLCKSQERVAAHFLAEAQRAGKEVRPATATPACADPGPFVVSPPPASPASAVAAAKPAGK